MKLKIAWILTLLIYIILLFLINKDPFLIGYLCAIDFAISFILLVLIFNNQQKKS